MGLIAIGDVHGCAHSLDALIDELRPTPDDHLVFVGDYVDRGPNSSGVINRLIDLTERTRCTYLRGNHEALMLDYLDGGGFELWKMNGGLETLESYKAVSGEYEIPERHVDFLEATRLYYDADDFFFVHAGLRPQLTIKENIERGDEQIFLWERAHLQANDVAWEKPVVCGHTPHDAPVNEEKLILIDTGCVYHMHPGMGKLTAVRLPEREFISVPYQG
ncbi:MAG: metallophosphoesterase family protein [Rhodothermales bacterium]